MTALWNFSIVFGVIQAVIDSPKFEKGNLRSMSALDGQVYRVALWHILLFEALFAENALVVLVKEMFKRAISRPHLFHPDYNSVRVLFEEQCPCFVRGLEWFLIFYF